MVPARTSRRRRLGQTAKARSDRSLAYREGYRPVSCNGFLLESSKVFLGIVGHAGPC